MESEYLKTALDAVDKAADILKKCFGNVSVFEIKEDRSPVTVVDKEVETVIRETIRKTFPDHEFLGEEFGKSDFKKSNYLWIIDPIDGTNNFIRGIPVFGIELALMKDEELILGVSSAPMLKELMWAEKGKGSYLNGEKIKVSTVRNLNEAFISYGNFVHFENSQRMDQLSNLVKETMGHRGFGDFWAYHLLSQGKIDIVAEARIKIWDIAAMKVIVEEAGGRMTSFEGDPIDKNISNVVATNGLLQNQVLLKLK